MTYIELLSPARDLATGIAAIDHGADAVYIGAPRFGARAAAGNPISDIRQLCDYAHRFGAKVDVTLNTILYEEELEDARRLAFELYEAGVDALIVQDFALVEMQRQGNFPPIALHASTQMDNRSAEHVRWLSQQGFQQVVLARELQIDEIRRIHEAVPEVTIEAFVHGALCVSYSGRCYASQHCFGRSANRGECAQFCRLPFSLEDADGQTLIEDKYLLSLRDMNRIGQLEEMIDAGVRSFKIEGRLKDLTYVKNVTASYRRALDDIFRRRKEYCRSSFGETSYTFTPDLSRAFSRGNTEYFLHGRTTDLTSPDTPKSRGREVGHVKEVRRGCIIVASSDTFANGDGLCFFGEGGKLEGFRVNRAEGNHLYPASMPAVRKGDRLWRSYDQQWEREMDGQTAERRLAAQFTLSETTGGFQLRFTAEDGTDRTLDFPLEHQVARTDQSDSIRTTLSKLGDTPFVCTDVTIRFSQPWFIPRSMLAEWKRAATTINGERRPATTDGATLRQENPVQCHGHEEQTAYASAINVSNSLAHRFYEAQGIKVKEQAMEIATPGETKQEGTVLMTCRYCLRHAIGCCKRESKTSIKEPLFLVSKDGRRFMLRFDCRRCEMQVLTAAPSRP